MNCHEAQSRLSLYLYGELDFAEEEQLEQHLSECALCQRVLGREKTWHTTLNSAQADVPLDLLASCRRELRSKVADASHQGERHFLWSGWLHSLGFSATAWSMRLAAASLLLFVGFSAARWMDRNGLPGFQPGPTSNMSVLGTPSAQIRDIQESGNGSVHIVFDQISRREITGRATDETVRQFLLAAMRDPSDPGIRVDSAEILKGQDGADVRNALIYSARHDANAAVRIKALEGLRRFSEDPMTRETLAYVLERDEDAGVRSEAIDVLASASANVEFSPDLAATLEQVMQLQRQDDYVRGRCMQMLAEMNAASLDVH